jgi:ribosomal protein L28
MSNTKSRGNEDGNPEQKYFELSDSRVVNIKITTNCIKALDGFRRKALQ